MIYLHRMSKISTGYFDSSESHVSQMEYGMETEEGSHLYILYTLCSYLYIVQYVAYVYVSPCEYPIIEYQVTD